MPNDCTAAALSTSQLVSGVLLRMPLVIAGQQNVIRGLQEQMWTSAWSVMYSLCVLSGIPYKMPKQFRRMKRKPRTTRVPQDVGYSGPSVPQILRNDNRIDREIFTQYANIVAQPTGAQFVYSSDVNLASPTGYASYSSNYKEYRVLALTVDFVPGLQFAPAEAFNSVATTTTNYFPTIPMLLYTMREDLSLPTQSQWELNPTSNRIVPNNAPFTEVIKARGTIAMEWLSVGSSPTLAQVMAVKFSPGNTSTVSSAIGATKTTWLVEFRGRN